MTPISDAALLRLEQNVRESLDSRDESGLKVIGYGEVTTVLLAETPDGNYACKRLPGTRDRARAEAVAGTVGQYVAALKAAGVHPLENEARVLECSDGAFVVYSIQAAQPQETIGPDYFRTLSDEEALREAGRVYDMIDGAVSPSLATDGQLSNWVFDGEDIFYLDVSTPFMRDESGKELLDWRYFTTTVPWILRGYFLKQVPGLMDKYHSIRGQMIDFIANLIKEDLERLIPGTIALANERFEFEKPITQEEVRAYYKEDAALYELLQRVKRTDRWFHRHVLRKTYPFILPPKIERNV